MDDDARTVLDEKAARETACAMHRAMPIATRPLEARSGTSASPADGL